MVDKPLQSLNFPGRDYTYVNTPLSTASTFDNTVIYAIGDYVFYNRKLYKFIAAHSSGNWNSSQVEEVTVGNEIKEIENELSQKYTKPVNGIPANDLADGIIPDVPVQDVQINSISIVEQNGTANVPLASDANLGVIKTENGGYYGLNVNTAGRIALAPASVAQMKAGTGVFRPVVSSEEHTATFYGLAKAAGDTTQSASSNAVGTYTDEAKSAIKTMLDIKDEGIEVSDPNNDGILVFEEVGNLSNTGIIADTYSNLTTYDVGDYCIYEKRLYKCTSEISTAEEWNSSHWTIVNVGDELVDIKNDIPEVPVQDVQIDGTSILNNGVANIPKAGNSTLGAMMVGNGLEVSISGRVYTSRAGSVTIKAQTAEYNPITPKFQHEATFYGLAKAAGDTTQASSSNAVGTYTDDAKVAIKSMLGVNDVVTDITVSGTTPTITAVANTRYICGEVATLDFTPSSTGICDVIFESGSTATVLTLPSTVKMPEWFDATTLEANTIYEISIIDGVYGAVMSWQA